MFLDAICQATFEDPDTFWAAIGSLGQALEALVVLLSAPFIIVQLRQIRRESIENKVAGLRTALEELRRDPFDRVSRQALSGARIEAVDWQSVLEQLNTVALLVSEGYTNRELLLRLKGRDLVSVGQQLKRNVELESDYPLLSELLKAAEQQIYSSSRY